MDINTPFLKGIKNLTPLEQCSAFPALFIDVLFNTLIKVCFLPIYDCKCYTIIVRFDSLIFYI